MRAKVYVDPSEGIITMVGEEFEDVGILFSKDENPVLVYTLEGQDEDEIFKKHNRFLDMDTYWKAAELLTDAPSWVDIKDSQPKNGEFVYVKLHERSTNYDICVYFEDERKTMFMVDQYGNSGGSYQLWRSLPSQPAPDSPLSLDTGEIIHVDGEWFTIYKG